MSEPQPDPDRWIDDMNALIAKRARPGAPACHPLRDGVIIERLDQPERTAGGLWIPKSAQTPMQIGRVVVVGQGAIDEDGKPTGPVCEVGDVVMYTGPWQGEDFELEGERYRKLDNGQLAAVVEDWDGDAVDVRHWR